MAFKEAGPINSSEAHATGFNRGQEDFARLINSIKDYAIFLMDPNGFIQTWNPGAEHIKGYTAEEIIGKHFSTFYTEADRSIDHPSKELQIAAKEGRYEEEGWRIKKDGSKFWANVIITRLTNELGELIGFSKVTRDLTERKKSEEALRQSEERFRLMVESVKDYAILMLDPEGNIVSWNAGAERIKGWSADEIIGQHFSQFYPAEDINAGKPEYELEVTRRVGRFEDIGWRLRKDGSRFWANVVITALRDDNGDIRGFSKVTRDITDKLHAEEALKKAYVELEKRVEDRTKELTAANKSIEALVSDLKNALMSRDEFLSIASHELKTPLTSLFIQAQQQVRLIEKDELRALDKRRVKHMAEQTVRLSKRLNRLVDDMLDISRIRSGKLSMIKEEVDLKDLVNEVVKRLTNQFEQYECGIPNFKGESILGQWDPDRLEQVVSNLLTNAMKYGQGKPITITLQQQKGMVLLKVRDEGIGISKEALDRIFNRFERAISANEVSGLGLGLYISREIIKQHGGDISVVSEIGKGAEFIVELPIRKE